MESAHYSFTIRALMKGLAPGMAFVLFAVSSVPGCAADNHVINMPEYLQMVKDKNFSAKGSEQQKTGAEGSKREADLIFSPSVFANGQVSSDMTPQDMNVVGMTYDKLETRKYSFGLSQTYNFGLQAKLYYSMQHVHYFFPGQPDNVHYNASPVIELSQSLWQNAKGRYDRSKEEATRAGFESEKWTAENDLRSLLVNAEQAYWNLAIAREVVTIRERAVADAKAILDYDTKRVMMNLLDKSDILQATASWESKKLDLKSAEDSQAAALRSFCSYINEAPDNVLGIEPVDWNILRQSADIARQGDRADVKKAAADATQNSANARMSAENDKPVFNVYLSQTLNGQDPSLTSVVGDSLNFNKPSTTVGVKFSIPLKYDVQKEARTGAEQKEKAAELIYRQKLLDQESDWCDLAAKLRDARERLEMAFSIEAAQKEKFEYEKKRLGAGRTTTYQVLSFEQDFSQAQYDRASIALTVLALAAQMKLYGDMPQPPTFSGNSK